MKKVAFILAGLLVMMFAGCGEGSSSSGAANGGTPPAGNNGTNPNTGNNVVDDVRGLTQFPAVPAIPES